MSRPPARSLEQRTQDVRHRLVHDVDLWIATADPDTANPYLVPLSFLWDGAVLVSTPAASITGRNLRSTTKARVGLGLVRDVVMVDGPVETLTADQVGDDVCATFAAKTGFDPRAESDDYVYFRIQPRRIQAWREANELPGRDVMRDGAWLADG